MAFLREVVGGVDALEVLDRFDRRDDGLGVGRVGHPDAFEQHVRGVVAVGHRDRHEQLRILGIVAPPAVGAVLRLIGLGELRRCRTHGISKRADHRAQGAQRQFTRAFLVGLSQGAIGCHQRHVHVQPGHGPAQDGQVLAQADGGDRVDVGALQARNLRGHVLSALVVGIGRDRLGATVLAYGGGQVVNARHAVGGAFMHDADALEALGQVFAHRHGLDVVLQREREHVGPRLLPGLLARVGHDRCLRDRIHVGPAVGLGHVDHG